MNCRLIAFDLDGTLLDDNKNLAPRTLAALNAAADRGIQLVPATGRVYDAIPEPVRCLPYIKYCITCNGAGVYDVAAKDYIYTADISVERTLEIFDYLESLGLVYEAFQDYIPYIEQDTLNTVLEYYSDEPGLQKLFHETRFVCPNLREQIGKSSRPVQKAQCHFRNAEDKYKVMPVLEKVFPDICATSSLSHNIELNSIYATKGKGLEVLCSHLGIDISDTVAFGDGSNDESMVRAAGLGVAMANSQSALLKAADIVTSSNNDCGVAAIIEKLLAGEL